MRKRTIRSGMRMISAALLLIMYASFYHNAVADLLSLSSGSVQFIYSQSFFWATAIGCYGVLVTVIGCVRTSDNRDAGVRILPVVMLIVGLIVVFFYLSAMYLDTPIERQRLRNGESITI